MQVVNDPNICHACDAQLFDDGDLIFRFAEPPSMIVKADCAPLFLRSFSDCFDALGLGTHAGALPLRVAGWLSAAHHPELCFEVMPLQHGENQSAFIV